MREGVDYPATLFTVFDGDTRVDPLHARKMCAALQHATTALDGPILLRNETEVGHGARAVSRSVELAADMLAFLAAHTGLNDRPATGSSPTDTRPRQRADELTSNRRRTGNGPTTSGGLKIRPRPAEDQRSGPRPIADRRSRHDGGDQVGDR